MQFICLLFHRSTLMDYIDSNSRWVHCGWWDRHSWIHAKTFKRMKKFSFSVLLSSLTSRMVVCVMCMLSECDGIIKHCLKQTKLSFFIRFVSGIIGDFVVNEIYSFLYLRYSYLHELPAPSIERDDHHFFFLTWHILWLCVTINWNSHEFNLAFWWANAYNNKAFADTKMYLQRKKMLTKFMACYRNSPFLIISIYG